MKFLATLTQMRKMRRQQGRGQTSVRRNHPNADFKKSNSYKDRPDGHKNGHGQFIGGSARCQNELRVSLWISHISF